MKNEPQAKNDIKTTSPALRVLPIVVLTAVLLYFAVQIYNYFSDPLTTTLVYESQAEDIISLDGWLVRDEEPLPSQSGTVSYAIEEGQKVGAGQKVATVYADESALQTVSRMETLELQLQQLEFALTSYLDPDAALKLDTSITSDLLTLRQTLCAGDYAAAESDLSTLKASVLKRDHAYTDQEEVQTQIKSVESELSTLKASLSGATTVTADSPGTFSTACDGYEEVLTPEILDALTPSKLDSLRSAQTHSNVGKLIYGDTWYYVVSLPYEQAQSLKSMSSVSIRLAKGFEQTIRMHLERVSEEENGEAVVVLSASKYLAQTTLLRHQAADAVLHTYEGLRVPANALRVSEDGVTGVYCVDGENASFRPVTLLYQGENYALVQPAEGVSDTKTLRAGDEVIATSGALFDGKVIR